MEAHKQKEALFEETLKLCNDKYIKALKPINNEINTINKKLNKIIKYLNISQKEE